MFHVVWKSGMIAPCTHANAGRTPPVFTASGLLQSTGIVEASKARVVSLRLRSYGLCDTMRLHLNVLTRMLDPK
jgi:hypothetical protein